MSKPAAERILYGEPGPDGATPFWRMPTLWAAAKGKPAIEVAIVDPASRAVVGRVPTVKDPHEVTVSTDGRLAFVASPSEGIAVIDLAAQKELRRVDPGVRSAPHDVLFADGKVYFTAEGFKTIGRYDPSANRIDWMLGIGQNGTHMLVLSQRPRYAPLSRMQVCLRLCGRPSVPAPTARA